MTEAAPEKYAKQLARQGFDLANQIGSGLSGKVYLASQSSLTRKVAVKFFDSKLASQDPSLKRRFIREAQILAEVQHPNIPYVLTHGLIQPGEGEIPYTVLQYIDGETLKELKECNIDLPMSRALSIVRQVLNALDYVHHRKVVHRDVKPANIMLLKNEHVFLIDFSIGFSMNSRDGLTRVTSFGEHLGSVDYMSPEQLKDMSSIDGRSDLYSLGIVLLELITGDTDRTNLAQSLAAVDRHVREAVVKVLSPNPDDRFQTAEEFLRALGPASFRSYAKPGLALCNNTTCSVADWSSRGYYRAPAFFEDSSDSFCTACGSTLAYTCQNCGAEIEKNPYCGACGSQLYKVPECEKCGSLLEKLDMGKDTSRHGCGKCRRAANSGPPPADFDDDIPF